MDDFEAYNLLFYMYYLLLILSGKSKRTFIYKSQQKEKNKLIFSDLYKEHFLTATDVLKRYLDL